VSHRFFAGGDQSIRGFDYQSQGPTITVNSDTQTKELVVGGRYLAVGSLEYQYYFAPAWRAALFTDGGNAFDFRESENFDLLYSVGTGVHWISPIGPVRLDVAYGLSESDPEVKFHITIGAEL